MDKKTVIAELIDCANILDENDYPKFANTITDLAERVAQIFESYDDLYVPDGENPLSNEEWIPFENNWDEDSQVPSDEADEDLDMPPIDDQLDAEMEDRLSGGGGDFDFGSEI